jgi:hypothetical protein
LIIFLKAFRDSFVTATEATSQLTTDAIAKLHKVEAVEEGLLLGESAEYTDSQAHRPTPTPKTQPSFPTHATRAKLRFPPKSIFLEINRVNNIITCWCRRRLPPENGRSWEKLFLCNVVASASLSPLRKPSHKGTMLLRQNLTPPPSIGGEQTLNLN